MSKLSKALIAAAGNSGGAGLTVEDVFSTYLYTGNGATQTITNGIDLAGEGGLVWSKIRSGFNSPLSHSLFDTSRGALNRLSSDLTNAETSTANSLTAFNSTGFTLGSSVTVNGGGAGDSYASWTFRKAPGFFDVVTYTGTGSNQTISHNLGSVPGCIIARALSGDNWYVWHSSLPTGSLSSSTGHKRLILNSTAAQETRNGINTVTSSSFDILGSDGEVGGNGTSYVAYVFANDAGGFGDDGSESIIKCGSYTGTGTVDTLAINLGFEPQWIMVKSATTTKSWYIQDVMRGMPLPNNIGETLSPDTSSARANKRWFYPTPTGVRAYDNEIEYNQSGQTYIYIAIRRPMKTPESGTEVFAPVAYSGNSTAGRSITSGFPLDAVFTKGRNAAIEPILYSRLQGSAKKLLTYSTSAEASSSTNVITSFDQDGMTVGTDADINSSAYTYINYFFKRATGFFDVVAYSGDGVAGRTVNHNLGVAPELMIFKTRNATGSWIVYHTSLGAGKFLYMNFTNAATTSTLPFNGTDPTSEVFTVGNYTHTNGSGDTMIAYLFGSVDGVSKVGSYTGTGADLNVDCGFSAGARFVLIKRTDSTGDWYVWDSVRGIVAGNDPYLLLNSTAAEVTSTDYIDPLSSGFTVTSSAPAALNASGGSFVYLAIAQEYQLWNTEYNQAAKS